MTRAVCVLYRGLIWLHPPSFRRQFAPEMLWIFDEAAASGAMMGMFTDGLISVARQWFLRQGTWKVAVAALGGLLHISLLLGALSSVLPISK